MSEENQSWPTFFENAQKFLGEKLKARTLARMSSQFLDQERTRKMQDAVRCARLTRDFLAGEFWNDFFAPLLNKEQTLKPWKPGDSLWLEEVSSAHLVASGKALLGAKILSTFEEWIRAGDEAAKALKLDEERREAARV